MFYIAVQKGRGDVWMGTGLPDRGWKWKGSLILMNAGIVGMSVALMISGYEQAFVERAAEGSTWAGYFAAQMHPWYIQGMRWRMISGVVMAAGFILLIWDLLTLGRRETRPAETLMRPIKEIQ